MPWRLTEKWPSLDLVERGLPPVCVFLSSLRQWEITLCHGNSLQIVKSLKPRGLSGASWFLHTARRSVSHGADATHQAAQQGGHRDGQPHSALSWGSFLLVLEKVPGPAVRLKISCISLSPQQRFPACGHPDGSHDIYFYKEMSHHVTSGRCLRGPCHSR